MRHNQWFDRHLRCYLSSFCFVFTFSTFSDIHFRQPLKLKLTICNPNLQAESDLECFSEKQEQ